MAYQNYTSSNDFEQLNSNISNSIYKIRQNVNQVVQLAKSIGTSKDSDSLRNNIHKVFQSTNDIVQQTNVNLKKLANIRTNDSELAFSKSKRAFESEIENYSRLQKEVSEKLRKTAVIPQTSNDSIDEISETTNLLNRQKQMQSQDLDDRFNFVKDRETKIKQIETDILDINVIMKDLANMVHEQTSLVDNITSNVENTNSNVEAANSQLTQANKYASKYRKKVLILILVIVVVLIAVGLIIYFSVKK